MARICFLFLIAFCVYLASDRPVFAQPIEFVLQDTVKKKNVKDTLRLDTIQVKRKNSLAEDKLNEKKETYKSIYALGDSKEMVNLPKKGGVGLSINKLYNKLSRKGRNARKLQRQFEKEYQQDLIREEWYPLTKEYSKLSGDSLRKFRIYYEPTIKWFHEHDRYEKIAYIHKCLTYYLDSVDIIHRRLQFPMGNAKL